MSILVAVILGSTVPSGEFARVQEAFDSRDAYRSVRVEAGATAFAPLPEEGWEAPVEAFSVAPGEILVLSIEDRGVLRSFPDVRGLGDVKTRLVRVPWTGAPSSWEELAGYDAVVVLGDGIGPDEKATALRTFLLCGGSAILSLQAARTLLAGTGIEEARPFAVVLEDKRKRARTWRGGLADGSLLLVDTGWLSGPDAQEGRRGLDEVFAGFLKESGRPIACPRGREFPALISVAEKLFERELSVGDLKRLLWVAGLLLAAGVLLNFPWKSRRVLEWVVGAAALVGTLLVAFDVRLPPEVLRAGIFYVDAQGRASGGFEFVLSRPERTLTVGSAGPVRPLAASAGEALVNRYSLYARPDRYEMELASGRRPAAVQVVRNDVCGREIVIDEFPPLDEEEPGAAIIRVLWEAAPRFPVGKGIRGVPFPNAISEKVGGKKPGRTLAVSLLLLQEEPGSVRDTGY